MVVLDVSASLSSDTFSREGAALERLARSTGDMALVLFSDSAYEALPPGTPASELLPIARLFTLPPPDKAYGAAQSLPTNPWTETFTSGTKISAGLRLAGDILEREHARHGHVILVSDLADDPQDILSLGSSMLRLYGLGSTIRAVALDPSPADTAYFGRLLGRLGQPSVVTAPTPEQAREAPGPTATTRTALVVLALVALLALAVGEWFGARLGPPRQEPVT